MQGTSQVLQSTQKRLEEVKRIRNAIANGDSVLTDQEMRQIMQQAALLGEDGDAMIGEILNQVKEVMNQPADVLRMVEDYLRNLGRRAALRELSLELEKEMAP
jgi:DNA repair ATPase RecN